MNQRLSGQVDLTLLRDPAAAQDLLASLVLHGASRACAAGVVCVAAGTAHRRSDGPPGNVAAADPAAVILAAWQESGAELCSSLAGGYAFAVVDAVRQCVFLAVDRFAIESLCFRLDERTLAFSDRADCVAGRGDELDPQAIFDYLYFHMIPAPRTIFHRVRRLPAAHALLVDRQGARDLRHWPVHFDAPRHLPFDGARETFRRLIRDNVAREIAGHAQVGAFLSGGTDSSTVAGVLGQVTGKPALAYSIGFAAEGYDEMEYARIAAKHFGCRHREYYVTPEDLVADIPAVAQHHDQPFGNSSALPAYTCAKLARADGCSKMLAGDGGDELFGGNSRYATQRVFQLYHSVPGGMRRLIEPLCHDASPLRRIPGLRQATGYVRHARVPMPDRMQSFNLLMQLGPAAVLTADFLGRIDAGEPSRHTRATWDECTTPSLVNRMLAYDWRYTLADSDLPKVRGAAQMAGIAVGFPLLADSLADFSLTLPANWKVRGFKLRWFFKEALRGFLPDEIITKKKKGFGLPFGVWATRTPALRQLCEESLVSLAQRDIVRADFVRRLFAEYLPEHPGYYGEMVWILTMLEQWLRRLEADGGSVRLAAGGTDLGQ